MAPLLLLLGVALVLAILLGVVAAGIRLGANSTANYNTGTYGSPVWVALATKDVSISLDMEEADATTRNSSKVKMAEPTLLGIGFEFEMLEIPGSTDFETIRTNFFARTLTDMLFSSGVSTAASGENQVRVECKIFGFKKGEPLNGINVYTVSMKPCYSTNAPTTAVL